VEEGNKSARIASLTRYFQDPIVAVAQRRNFRHLDVQAKVLRRPMRIVARQAALDPGDGIDL
jgi:hypothetical protein